MNIDPFKVLADARRMAVAFSVAVALGKRSGTPRRKHKGVALVSPGRLTRRGVQPHPHTLGGDKYLHSSRT